MSTLFACMLGCAMNFSATGQGIPAPHALSTYTPAESTDIVMQAPSEEKESRARRGEIVFFLSAPFLLAGHAILVGGALATAGMLDQQIPIPVIAYGASSFALFSWAVIKVDQEKVYGKRRSRAQNGELRTQMRWTQRF